MALDRDEIIHYESLNNGKPIATMSMRGEEGHNASLIPYEFNPAKARQLLSDAGVKPPLVLKTLVREQGARVAGAIKAQLEENIDVKLDVHVFADADVIKALQSEEWDLAIAGLPDTWGSMFFLSSIFLYSRSPFSLTHSPDFDKKLEAMMMILDDKERDLYGKELDSYIYNQALGLFTFQRIKTYGVNERLRFIPSVTGVHYFFRAYFSTPPTQKKAVRIE
jgi:peptide/nickel transport system substrate-binding protein